MTYDSFVNDKSSLGIFDLTSNHDVSFIKYCLLRYKPRETDKPGYLYIYYRKHDLDMIKEGKLSHLILFKMGRTVNLPSKRVY
jgi:hypothetical protein